MKKALLIILALTLCLAMAGCGAKESGTEPEEPAETETETEEEAEETDQEDQQEGEDASILAFPPFESMDAYGQPLSSAIFSGKDVTMINLWGTYCSPCIGEMPELEKISQALPENAQILGLVIDVAKGDQDMMASAQEIIESTGVTYPSILVTEELLPMLYSFQYVPTTLFVDSEGKVIADMVIGADLEKYVSTLESLLEGWTYEG